MICHNCHKNGHTETRCRRKAVCRNCGEDEYTSDKANKYPNESKCPNCGEGHMAGNNDCEIEIKEKVIKKCKLIAEWEENESPRSNLHSNPTHFRCKMD